MESGKIKANEFPVDNNAINNVYNGSKVSLVEPGRAVGNTTRQADELIQLLFNNVGKRVVIVDHGEKNKRESKGASYGLLKIINDRFEREHFIWSKFRRNFELKLKIVHTTRGDEFVNLPFIPSPDEQINLITLSLVRKQ